MFLFYGMSSAAVVGALSMFVMHLPRVCKRIYVALPDYFHAMLIHFGYAFWLGGVSGHLIGALASIPFYFISKYWLRPWLHQRLAEPGNGIFRRAWRTIKSWFGIPAPDGTPEVPAY